MNEQDKVITQKATLPNSKQDRSFCGIVGSSSHEAQTG